MKKNGRKKVITDAGIRTTVSGSEDKVVTDCATEAFTPLTDFNVYLTLLIFGSL